MTLHIEQVSPKPPPDPIRQLTALVMESDSLAARTLHSNLDPETLPAALREAWYEVVSAEGSLLSILRDIAAEHGGVES